MLKCLQNIRIRNRLFITYSLIFMLSFAVTGAFIFYQVRTIVRDNIQSELTRTTETIRNMVLNSADVAIRNYMRAVAEKNLDVARHLHRQVQRGFLSEAEAKKQATDVFLSQKLGSAGRVYCLNSNGIMVVHHKRSLLDVDLSGLPFVQEQIQSKSGFMTYDWREPLEKVSRPKAIYMTYFEPWDWIISVSTYRDEFTDLVNISDFKQRILNLGYGESGYPFIIDYEGHMLMHPHLQDKHYSEYGDPRLSQVAEQIVEKKNGQINYLWQNPGDPGLRKKIAYFQDIPELGWIVASSSLYEDFEGPLDSITLVFVVALTILIILILPLSVWISSQITKPLEELQSDFAKAASGDFSVRMKQHSRDEIGLLAGYFNWFMQKLTEYSDDLRTEIAVRKEAERKLIAMDENKTLFLASASHELRTPLTSIIGFLKLMDRNFNVRFRPRLEENVETREKAAQFAENLEVVRNEADRLGVLVNDLLDLSKIESGRMEWRDSHEDVRDILDRAARSVVIYTEQNRDVEFILERPTSEAFVRVDADRIHQVLINLLNNAFKYTHEGTVTLRGQVTADAIQFSVCDTGRGIPEADQDRIFDVFYQVDDVNQRSSQIFGTGLGLAISRNIVQHYNGSLSVTSTPGKGSCFRFSLQRVY
ncbi:MAG: histidine kinase [Desulfovibrio sp.]|nr:histidine kinase [Desulfovibrio sp.]|tara:strand:- start:1289 stop:3232 length:1944 start_codon:yes stop_codon:yes gene_type:complete